MRNLLAVSAAFGLLLNGCGGSGTASAPSAETGADTTAAASGPVGAAASGIAKVLTAEADIGENLPAFVERPAGSSILMNSFADNGTKHGGSVLYATSESPDALIAFHKAAFERHGLVAGEEKAGKRGERILIADNADKTTGITVAVHPPKDDGSVVVDLGFFEPMAK